MNLEGRKTHVTTMRAYVAQRLWDQGMHRDHTVEARLRTAEAHLKHLERRLARLEHLEISRGRDE